MNRIRPSRHTFLRNGAWGTISRIKINLQTKFGFSYILVIILVLIIMNTYPLVISQNMIFRSKQESLSTSVRIAESALSDIDELSEANVSAVMSGLKETGVSRILVTDAAGLILYDTRETGSAVGMYALYTEIVEALGGKDAFYSEYDSDAFISRCTAPVVFHNQIIGAVYMYDYDVEQAALLQNLQSTLARISLVVAGITVILSFGLGRLLTRQITSLLEAMQHVKEGAYSARAQVTSGDEIGDIAEEFNRLTARLEETENARRRFVSDASHELKTPLAGIRLMTDSILQTENIDIETAKDFVQDIGQEAERLTRITEDLLKLTKLEQGVSVRENEIIRVQPVVLKVIHMLSVLAKEKQVTISSDVSPEACMFGNGDDLHQILYNLIENGVKYSNADGFVHVNGKVQDEHVVITIEDHGLGIPEQDQEHIFERFYRVDKNRSRAMGGTGLGLAIAKETAEKMQGNIAVQSRSGGGTIFTLTFPAVKEQGDE